MSKVNYIAEIKANAAAITTSMRGVEKLAHETVILCGSQCFMNRYDTSGFKVLFTALENVKGSFRLQGLIDYCAEVFDITVENDKEKGYGYIVKRGKDKRINTTAARRKAMDYAKSNPFYDWLPDEAPLKTPKLNQHWAVVPARGYATGDISKADIIAEYGEFGFGKVLDALKDEKVQTWAVKYLQQSLAA